MVAQDQLRFSFAFIRSKLKGKVCVYKKPEVGPQVSTCSGIRNIDIVDSLFK